MLLACLTNSYGRFGPDAAVAHLPQVGVRWMELPIRNAGVASFFRETPWLDDASQFKDCERVLKRLEGANLELSSCNITSGNPLGGEVVERTLRKLRLAAQLGVRFVVAGAGAIEDDSQWSQLVENLRRIGDTAGEAGIVYCCETHPGVCENAYRMAECMQRVNHPHVRLNLDTGNLFFYNRSCDLAAELETAWPWVAHVHLKDTPGGYQEWNFPALGQGGAVDFTLVRRYLNQKPAELFCSLEIEGVQGEPEPTLELTQQRIADSVEYLRTLSMR